MPAMTLCISSRNNVTLGLCACGLEQGIYNTLSGLYPYMKSVESGNIAPRATHLIVRGRSDRLQTWRAFAICGGVLRLRDDYQDAPLQPATVGTHHLALLLLVSALLIES